MAAHLIDLHEGEHILKEVRRDQFIFYSRVAVLIILVLLPLVVAVPAAQALTAKLTLPGGILVGIAYGLWFLFLWIIFFVRWTDYHLDVWVITNQRIFDIEQKRMFHRDVSVFRIESIQDITVEVNGMLATFLKYGDIHIHTAGEKQDLIIRDASNPLAIKKLIMEQHAKALQHSQGKP